MGLEVIGGILLVVSFLAFIVSAGFLTDSSHRITGIPEYEANNTDLNTAHRYSYIGAIVAWITVAFLLIGGILLFIYGGAEIYASGTSKFFIYGVLFICLLGTIVVGILAILTAIYINRANVSDNNGAYQQAIIAAVIATVVFVLVIVVLLIKVFYKPKNKEVEAEDKKIEEEKEELKELDLT